MESEAAEVWAKALNMANELKLKMSAEIIRIAIGGKPKQNRWIAQGCCPPTLGCGP